MCWALKRIQSEGTRSMLRKGQRAATQEEQGVTADIAATSLREVIEEILRSTDGRRFYRERVAANKTQPAKAPPKKGSRVPTLGVPRGPTQPRDI